jgi:flagellar basal body-associated protein FliL
VATNQTSENENHSEAGILSCLRIIASVTAAAFCHLHGRPTEASPPEPVPQAKSTLHLESFVLNLADPEAQSYVRVGIDLRVGREKAKPDEVLPVAPVRDAILGVLSHARVDGLLSESGQSKSKRPTFFRALQEQVPQRMVRKNASPNS